MNFPSHIAIVGSTDGDIHLVRVRNLQRQLGIDAEWFPGLDTSGNRSNAAINRMTGHENLIAGDIVRELELDRGLAAVRQNKSRVPVNGFGKIAPHIAQGGVALVGVLAEDQGGD